MEKNKSSKLCIKIDWISFCISETDLYTALHYMSFRYEDFKDLRHGGRGYRNMLQHNMYDINVYFGGSDAMGVHFEVKGGAVYDFVNIVIHRKFGIKNPFDGEECLPLGLEDVREIFKLILNNGWFNRIDIAIDDVGTNFFTCKRLFELLDNRQYVAKFKCFDNFVSRDASGNVKGHTIYLGSKASSDMFIRVYDKFLEQQKKADKLSCNSWIRWELVIKDKKADIFAGYIVDGIEIGACVRSVLSGYMRLIKKDNVNRSRCSTIPKWDRFVNSVESLSLSLPRENRTVEKARNWIEHQVMPTLAGLVCAYQGDMSFFYDHLQEHFERLKMTDQEMFKNYKGDDENVNT